MPDGRHGGNIAPDKIILDFSVNTNPCGMPQSVKEALAAAAQQGEYYPEITYHRLREEICRYEQTHYKGAEDLKEGQILPGSGASELIMALAHAYHGCRVLLQTPLFSGYERAFLAAGATILRTESDSVYGEQKAVSDYTLSVRTPKQILEQSPDMVVLCHPGNPTGAMTDARLLEEIKDACIRTGAMLVADECFIGFVKDSGARSSTRFLSSGCDLVILRAFTKLYAMPGIRLGYAICAGTKTAERLGCHLPEWNVSAPAQAAGLAALKEEDYVRTTTAGIREERERFEKCLKSLGFRTIPGEANFILLYSEVELYAPLLRRGILIRKCDNYYGIPESGYYRAAVRTREENDRLLEALEEIPGREYKAAKETE